MGDSTVHKTDDAPNLPADTGRRGSAFSSCSMLGGRRHSETGRSLIALPGALRRGTRLGSRGASISTATRAGTRSTIGTHLG